MANTNAPFTPTTAASLAVTGTAASVTLPTLGDTMLIMNDGAVTCFWKTGVTTATADATSNPILAGAVVLYTATPGDTVLSGIAATGATTTLRIQRGYGV
jgi:uncharacterized protein YcsI (UPF0317 family)